MYWASHYLLPPGRLDGSELGHLGLDGLLGQALLLLRLPPLLFQLLLHLHWEARSAPASGTGTRQGNAPRCAYCAPTTGTPAAKACRVRRYCSFACRLVIDISLYGAQTVPQRLSP